MRISIIRYCNVGMMKRIIIIGIVPGMMMVIVPYWELLVLQYWILVIVVLSRNVHNRTCMSMKALHVSMGL